MILSHLSKSKLLEATQAAIPSSPEAHPALEPTFVAIRALGEFAALLKTGINEFLFKLIIEGLPGIFAWMKFLFELYSDDSMKGLSAIHSMPGLLALVTRLWLAEDDDMDITITFSPSVFSSFFVGIVNFATTPIFDEVVSAVGGDASIIAETAAARLRCVLDKPGSPNPTHVAFCVVILFCLTSRRKPEPAMRRAEFGKRVIGLVTSALLRLSTGSLEPGGLGIRAVIAAVRCIIQLIAAGDGPTNVKLAIQAGMIQAFLNISSSFNFLEDNVDQELLTLIRVTLPQYFVYHSVLVVFARATRKIGSQEARTNVAETPIWDAWYAMKTLAAERLVIKCKYVDNGALSTEAAFCDYCRRAAPKAELKKLEERTQSRMPGESRRKNLTALKGDALRKEDIKFISFLALHDAWRHLPRLRRLAAQDLPGMPLANVGVQIDYTCVPEMYFVLPIASEGGKTSIQCLIAVGEWYTTASVISPTSLWEDVDFGRSLEFLNETDTIIDDVDIDLANMRGHKGSSVYRK
ncbi:hypothetical protein EVG20_g6736 [Dentipellis fragilis]|uniref:Uncharacterized protein n=1 Tax=Dentipellis fragilis TaxID=205917 RepID=A0A4Y9YIZ5_9AGAM|nr:hypothetical protein EVG20_g6736 [Dentipellis fragilis]